MPKEFSRSRRVAEQLQRELAQLLQFESKDPRVSGVTIQAVKLSKDLSVAKVYYTILGDSEPVTVQQGLEKAAGYLRHELGQRLKMRAIPVLRFLHDESISRGTALSQLIEEAVASDQAKHHEED